MPVFTVVPISGFVGINFGFQIFTMYRKIVLIIICLIRIAQAQETANEPYHVNRQFYGIGATRLMITNEFSLEEMGNVYLNYPYPDRNILLYGPTLSFYIGDEASFNNMLHYPVSYTIFTKDSSKLAASRLPLNNLYFRVLKKDSPNSAWSKLELKKKGEARYPYNIRIDRLVPGEKFAIELADTQKQSILRFRFERKEDPPFPYLAMYMKDTNTHASFSSFIARNLISLAGESEKINEFYQYWPNKYGAKLQSELVYPGTHMALYFRKPHLAYPDSCMEYKFEEKYHPQSVWYETGHRIFLSGFESGKTYVLTVRYKSLPESVQKFVFSVPSQDHKLFGWRELVLIVVSVGFILLFFVIRLILEKRKKKMYALQLRSLKSELNPHFIFNALASLQGLINKGEKEAANLYIASFSKLMRDTMNASEREEQSLSQELAMLENYLKLENLRYPFRYNIELDPSIPLNEINVPPLLMQPLVENAIKHGVAGMLESGNIIFAIQKREKDILISVSDNGKGFTMEEVTATKGLGLALTKERIKLLNSMLKGRSIKLKIGKNQEKGQSVQIELINWMA